MNKTRCLGTPLKVTMPTGLGMVSINTNDYGNHTWCWFAPLWGFNLSLIPCGSYIWTFTFIIDAIVEIVWIEMGPPWYGFHHHGFLKHPRCLGLGPLILKRWFHKKILGWHSNQKISHLLNPFVFPHPNALDFIWVAIIIIKVFMCANLASIELVLNCGIWQFSYH